MVNSFQLWQLAQCWPPQLFQTNQSDSKVNNSVADLCEMWQQSFHPKHEEPELLVQGPQGNHEKHSSATRYPAGDIIATNKLFDNLKTWKPKKKSTQIQHDTRK